jgi:putative tryptophan/tyrosine transport system substrate-binding protein
MITSRRTCVGMLAGITSWPLFAHAQQTRPVVGFLNNQSLTGWEPFTNAFERGLSDGGFMIGRDVEIDYRWASGQNELLPGLAAELVTRKINVLVATGGPNAALAAKRATSTVPTVFTVGGDPVLLGLVESLARPGGNMTGFTLFTQQLGPKRLEILRDLVPAATQFASLHNPDNADTIRQQAAAMEAAKVLGKSVFFIGAGSVDEFDAAFVKIAAAKPGALFVESDALFFANRARVAALAAKHAIPTIYESRSFVAAGGLISYGVNFIDVYRQAGLYVARILKGAKPTDLPVMQPTRLELVVNQTTARALGITLPPTILALADEVIE